MNGLPKQLFYVKVRQTESARLRMYEKGGGKYTSRAAAIQQRDRMIKKGLDAKLYESQPLVWKESE
jgi:hypothetical protein